jgi:hypothetical protein
VKAFVRIVILSAAASVALQATTALAGGKPKELWPEDSAASLSFGNPEDEDAPRSPARAEFINPETEERISMASAGFGDSDPESTAGRKDRTYFAGEPGHRLHPTQ